MKTNLFLIYSFFQLQQYLVEKFDNGFDYTFECVGNVEVMVNENISIHTYELSLFF